jgi:hypothetical protein
VLNRPIPGGRNALSHDAPNPWGELGTLLCAISLIWTSSVLFFRPIEVHRDLLYDWLYGQLTQRGTRAGAPSARSSAAVSNRRGSTSEYGRSTNWQAGNRCGRDEIGRLKIRSGACSSDQSFCGFQQILHCHGSAVARSAHCSWNRRGAPNRSHRYHSRTIENPTSTGVSDDEARLGKIPHRIRPAGSTRPRNALPFILMSACAADLLKSVVCRLIAHVDCWTLARFRSRSAPSVGNIRLLRVARDSSDAGCRADGTRGRTG